MPSGTKSVWKVAAEGSKYQAVLNLENGDVTRMDPRWPELPNSWRIIEGVKGEERPLYVHEDTEVETYSHPGLTPELLEGRGVRLRVFNII